MLIARLQVTDHDASKEFVEKIKAAGKPAEFRSFEGEPLLAGICCSEADAYTGPQAST